MLNTESQIQYSAILDFIYPIGSYFITESANYDTVEKVQSHFGGTWEQIKDCFLWATGDIDSITYTENGTSVTKSLTAGSTGGELAHMLSLDEMPSHRHQIGQYQDNFTWFAYAGKAGDVRYGIQHDYVAQKISGSDADLMWALNQGGSQAHNNMPPYRTVYMYRRTA